MWGNGRVCVRELSCKGSKASVQRGTAHETTPYISQVRFGGESPHRTLKVVAMRIILCWSKQRSRETAELLSGWLPRFLPGVEPWMSENDIGKGHSWWDELREALAQAKGCVIPITSENVRSTWLYFEAGRVAGNSGDTVICPYLVGIDSYALSGTPLSQFQCAEATKQDTQRLIKSLNRLLDERERHHEAVLEGNFEWAWPRFEESLHSIQPPVAGGVAPPPSQEARSLPHQPR